MSVYELCYFAALHRLDASAKTATFYLMNTTRNRNRWGVTEKSLSEALPSLLKKPLGMGKDYRIDKHYPEDETMDVGAFGSFEDKGSYALGTAEVEDAQTWSMLEKGALGPISVVIHAYSVVCSQCGEPLEAKPEAVEKHECFKQASTYELVESFVFHRVDFVDVPAYPQAGLLDLAAQTERKMVPIELLAGFYTSQGRPDNGQNQKEKEEANLSEKEEELKSKMAGLEQSNKTLTKDLADTKAAAAEDKKTIEILKAQLDAITKQRHDQFVDEAFTARAAAGLAGKPDEEKLKLAKLSDETLQLLKADADKVAAVLQSAATSTPKTKYAKDTGDSLEAAVDEKRKQLGFSKREKEGA